MRVVCLYVIYTDNAAWLLQMAIKYAELSDVDKLGYLQLLYHDMKHSAKAKQLILAEAMLVYARIKNRSN